LSTRKWFPQNSSWAPSTPFRCHSSFFSRRTCCRSFCRELEYPKSRYTCSSKNYRKPTFKSKDSRHFCIRRRQIGQKFYCFCSRGHAYVGGSAVSSCDLPSRSKSEKCS